MKRTALKIEQQEKLKRDTTQKSINISPALRVYPTVQTINDEPTWYYSFFIFLIVVL